MNVEQLKKIIFEDRKCPFHIVDRGERRTATIFDKEGMNVYSYVKGELDFKLLKPFDEITNEDLIALTEALERNKK